MAEQSAKALTARLTLPFPLERLTRQPWREQALTRIAEQRFALDWMLEQPGVNIPSELVETIQGHWKAAADVAGDPKRRGAAVERVESNLDAVEGDLLRIGPDDYIYGQLPGLLTRVAKVLPKDDLTRVRVEALLGDGKDTTTPAPLTYTERSLIVSVHNLVTREARQEITRLRSFARMLHWTAGLLAVAAIGLGALAAIWPSKLPVCFNPGANIVCPTSTTAIPGYPNAPSSGQPANIPASVSDAAVRNDASGWDVPLVEVIGLVAAAVAAAIALRGLRGSSKPFGMPVALAVLKLPTGMLTALLGLLLMRGEFIPGLSALDSSAQIISWAIVLGYSQQLLTRFVDQRAQTVLDNFSRSAEGKQQAEAVVGSGAPAV